MSDRYSDRPTKDPLSHLTLKVEVAKCFVREINQVLSR
jgi:hypothetical protein